jgi:hypothetical protein
MLPLAVITDHFTRLNLHLRTQALQRTADILHTIVVRIRAGHTRSERHLFRYVTIRTVAAKRNLRHSLRLRFWRSPASCQQQNAEAQYVNCSAH